jgi:hypothetical protein
VLRAYPGAGSGLLAFDVPDELQQDLAGFAVEATAPGEAPQFTKNGGPDAASVKRLVVEFDPANKTRVLFDSIQLVKR